MTEQQLHEVAVAYAQVKLKEYQLEQRTKHKTPYYSESDDNEVKYYAKMYKTIIEQFETEYDNIG